MTQPPVAAPPTPSAPLPPHPLKGKKYDIVLMDPPWSHYGDPNKMAAAGKHYTLMSDDDVKNLPVRSILKKDAYVFVWATGPRLGIALEAIKAWKLHYRGIAHVWVKTRKDGKIIHGQGIPPTYSKPTTELLLVATTRRTGRPVPLLDSALPQVVLEPRAGHSVKPAKFRQLIEKGLGQGNDKLEMFARQTVTGWDAIGDAVSAGEDIRVTLARMTEK